MTALGWVGLGASAGACVPAGVRWLRVCQREHYLAGSTTRFALRWWRSTPSNALLGIVALVAAVMAFAAPAAAVLTALVVALGPTPSGDNAATRKATPDNRLDQPPTPTTPTTPTAPTAPPPRPACRRPR